MGQSVSKLWLEIDLAQAGEELGVAEAAGTL
jgi:hypothetical protein